MLGGGLLSVGIPKDSVLQYESAVMSDKFLLIVSGSAAEAFNAKGILAATLPLSLPCMPAKNLQQPDNLEEKNDARHAS